MESYWMAKLERMSSVHHKKEVQKEIMNEKTNIQLNGQTFRAPPP